MKKSVKKLFQLAFIIFLFGCSTIKWVDDNKVTISWHPSTTMGVDSGEDAATEIRYLIYLAPSKSRKGSGALVDKFVDDILVDKETPIAETSCTIRFKDKGQFIIGVQAVTIDSDKNIKGRSAIAWSDKKKNTSKNPFGVKVGK